MGHAVEPADAGNAIEHPSKLGVLGDLTLVEDNVLLGVDATGKECSGYLAGRPRQFARILPHRDGVQIDDAVDAVIAILQCDKLGDRAEIVAEMQVAGRLHSGKYTLLEPHCPSFSIAEPCHGGGARRKALKFCDAPPQLVR